MNLFKKNLGYHFGAENSKTWLTEAIDASNRTKVLQFMVSSPRSYHQPNRNMLSSIVSLMGAGLRPVIHCPYLVTTTRNNPQLVDYTIQYVLNLYMQLGEFTDQTIPYVLHTGKPPKEDPEATKKTMLGFLQKLSTSLEKTRITNDLVCFETDASCYNPATRLPGLVDILNTFGDLRYGITLDTEHSFGSGYPIWNVIPDDHWNWIKVLHLNAIPAEVEFGKGLDRHSFTKIRECSQGAPYLHCFVEAIKRDLPIILERYEWDVINDDMTYLSDRYGPMFSKENTNPRPSTENDRRHLPARPQ